MSFLNISDSARPVSTPRKSLLNAPGADMGNGVIEWGGSEALTGLTEREVELVKKKLGVKRVNYIRTLAVKSLMKSKSCAEIVRHFRGRKGYRESTIKHTHAALSQAASEKNTI